MVTRYITAKTARMRVGRSSQQLLWGDPCHVIGTQGNQTEVRARGVRGLVPTADLGADPRLLELYVIDVGQGDGVLMKTPDGRWHLVDAGLANEAQDLRKGAANFLRWKFLEDLRRPRVELETVVISHADYDHYGGLIDLLSGVLPAYGTRPERPFDIRVRNLYHNGMGRFAGADPLGHTHAGSVAPFPRGYHGVRRNGTFITELLSDRQSFRNPARAFAGPFADLARLVGRVPSRVRRLDASDRHLPGYAPGTGPCTIHVLGPIVERFGNRLGLRELGGASKTRNGHSIVLRLDFGNARVLLTGDLNSKSQQLLLSYVPELEFTVDVAKACHHGSADVDPAFLQAMAARATISSSGDNESYAHPRPRVLGASGLYGRAGVDPRGRPVPPLIYSTELARSVSLSYATNYEVDFSEAGQDWTLGNVPPGDVRVTAENDGDTYQAGVTPIATDLVFGLVNVRTDGNEILFATMHEKGDQFDVELLRAGISP